MVKRAYRDANAQALLSLNSTDQPDQFSVADPANDGTVAVTLTLLPADYAAFPYVPDTDPPHWELEYYPAGGQGPTTVAAGDFALEAEVIRAS